MPAMKKPLAGRGGGVVEYKAALGDYIRELRFARGMTQHELAFTVNMKDAGAISNIETGRNNVPPERYLTFAEALGVNPKTFVLRVLSLTDPWAYTILFSKNPRAEIARINESMPTRHVGNIARRPKPETPDGSV